MSEHTENWQAGWKCCDRGVGRHQNPYPQETPEWKEWRAGWEARFYKEHKL